LNELPIWEDTDTIKNSPLEASDPAPIPQPDLHNNALSLTHLEEIQSVTDDAF
jgi:hypothetical protein